MCEQELPCVLFRMIPSSITPVSEEGCWPKACLGAYCVQEQLVKVVFDSLSPVCHIPSLGWVLCEEM